MSPLERAEQVFGPEPDWPGPIPSPARLPEPDLACKGDCCQRECEDCGWTLGPTDGDCPMCGWREDPL